MSAMTQPRDTPRPWFKKKRYIGLIALVAIFAIAAGSSGGSDDSLPTAAERAAEDRTEVTAAPEPEAPAPEEPPAEPELTSGQENAIASAESYLDYTAFSRSGLIQQLKSEKYSEADATFAVDYLKVDWKKQAALSAEQYLDYTSFSREGLIDQLMSEGFSRENAEYGATQAGL